jgi:hypothetical protein
LAKNVLNVMDWRKERWGDPEPLRVQGKHGDEETLRISDCGVRKIRHGDTRTRRYGDRAMRKEETLRRGEREMRRHCGIRNRRNQFKDKKMMGR